MEILLAEDEDLSAELLQRILEPILTKFDAVKTLAETLKKVAESHYDIIIYDLRLLDADVEESIGAIRHIKNIGKAPLLVVTGVPDPTVKSRCLEAGADGFIPKMEAYSAETHALQIAVYAATIHDPHPKSAGFMDKVRILEQLVHAI